MPTSSAETAHRPPPHLQVSGVTAGYGPVPVVNSMDLDVGHGECVVVVGPNGAGKSTLLKAIVGLVTLSHGTIAIGGKRIQGLRADVIARRGLGYVPQVRDIFDDLTVRENLEMGGYTLPARQVRGRVDEVLEQFQPLIPLCTRHAGRLSGGERKMLAIGRVLMTRPTALVLDEPTANLSPAMARLVLEETIPALARTGVAVLVVEQRAREALAVADWAYVLAAGRVALAGDAAIIRAVPDLGDVFLGRAAGGDLVRADPARPRGAPVPDPGGVR